jgi:alpha-mannosidase
MRLVVVWGIIVTTLVVSPGAHSQDFIHEWLILGEFTSSGNASLLSTDFLNGESSFVPVAGGRKAGRYWLRWLSDANTCDLTRQEIPFVQHDKAVAYLGVFCWSPNDQDCQLWCGSDDGIAVWLNARQVHFIDVKRGAIPDQDKINIRLISGWNTLLFKIANDSGGWGVCARINGATGIRYSCDNPFGQTPPEPTAFATVAAPDAQQFIMDEKDQAFLKINTLLVRTNKPVGDVPVYLVSGDQRSPMPALVSGQTVSQTVQVSLADVLISTVDQKPLEINFQEGTGSAVLLMPPFNPLNVLELLFQPWSLTGWQKVTTGNVKQLKRTFLSPPFKGLQQFAMINIGEAWGSFKCNGQVLKQRFNRDSGNLLISNSTTGMDRYDLVVTLEPSSADMAEIGEATIKLGYEKIENYVRILLYTKILTGVDVTSDPAFNLQLLKMVQTSQLPLVDAALEQKVTQLQAQVPKMDKYTVTLLGNAHIDLAWLWRYPETIEVYKNTFTSTLKNMHQFPEFTFAHGQAQGYYWMEQKYPDLFRQIQERVKAGQWEIIGGTWSQPDDNMPSGESMVRQYLYGKKYFKDKFGVDVHVGFMPDTFGHAGSLPQILKKCGIDYFIFFRPFEEERIFYWQSPDGSRVLAYRPPQWYNSNITPDIGMLPVQTEKSFGITNTLRCFGVGDHGGGPTARDIQLAIKLDKFDGYTNVKFGNMQQYFATIAPQTLPLNIYQGELNFVFDGCWTSQAMTKKYNRHLEALLPTAEMFAFFAQRFGIPYPQHLLETAWQQVLFNQFHDIMDGSGIAEVYNDSKIFYDKADSIGNAVLDQSLAQIIANVNTTPLKKELTPVVIFNSLNWSRSEPVEVTAECPSDRILEFSMIDGTVLKSCRTGDNKWLVSPLSIQAMGYTTIFYRIIKPKEFIKSQQELVLQSPFFIINIDPQSGNIGRFFDRRLNRDILSSSGNVLNLQHDDNESMTAWTIKLKGELIELSQPTSVQVVEENELRKVVRITHDVPPSKFEQDIILYSGEPRCDFIVRADWHHRDTMLKVAFPLDIQGKATFETPFGFIERQQGKREVVSQKWVDISTPEWGVSLLNDSKYGFDVNDNVIRMSLLRSPHDPDPKADEGQHEIHYSLYVHTGDWIKGETVRAAFAYNTPLTVKVTDAHTGTLPANYSFLKLDAANIVVTACKKAEYSNALVLRLYETDGQSGTVMINSDQTVMNVMELNMIEESLRPLISALSIPIRPYEVKTVALGF